jgi:Ala-tRNA(Pro) deacylase
MPAKIVRDFLDRNHIRYVTITHSPAYTAQDIAASAHVPGKELAKSVIVKLDGKMAMAVLPASKRVDLDHLRASSGAKRAELCSEAEFKDAFPGCEVGAMPPFGNLFGMDTYVDETLREDGEIAFNAGTHTELIRMATVAYESLVRPRVLEFSQPF